MIKYDTFITMKRSKIAITVREDILKRLDRAINGETIRNRSHAIEYFLNQALGAKVEKALIIAGHKDFSCTTPFEGKSVVEHQMELLKTHGVKNIFLLLHKGEKEVQKVLGDGTKYGLRIMYGWQGEEKIGTARALSLVKEFVAEDLFLVLYCHIVADLDLVDLVAYHTQADVVATVALTSIEDPSLYGAVEMKGEKIVAFAEKPKEKEGVSRVISAGIFCFSPEIFSIVPNKKDASLERDVFPKLAKEGKLAGYMFEGAWCNVRNQICLPGKKRK
ncbi:MAG: nucleotidyltransferase family protein [Patescibacteria group bacterium]